MPRHPSHRTPLEDTDPAFDRLKELSAEYWHLIKGDESAGLPGIDTAHESMWGEAIRQTRKGWEKRRYGWTGLAADIARCSTAHLAQRASDGWGGDMDQALREMRSSRTRSASGSWATPEPTEAEREELAELTRRADAYWTTAERAEQLKHAMVEEAVRLVKSGRRRGVYGQTAAVARVTGWTREHCSRLASKSRKKTAKKTTARGKRTRQGATPTAA